MRLPAPPLGHQPGCRLAPGPLDSNQSYQEDRRDEAREWALLPPSLDREQHLPSGHDGEVPRHRRAGRAIAARAASSIRDRLPGVWSPSRHLGAESLSFNSYGACPACHGLGVRCEVNAEREFGADRAFLARDPSTGADPGIQPSNEGFESPTWSPHYSSLVGIVLWWAPPGLDATCEEPGLVLRRGYGFGEGDTSAADLFDDFVGFGVPDERLGVVVPVLDPQFDGVD
jgi:hypothetical protein